MADHWRGTYAFTSPENFSAMQSPLAKVMKLAFYPYAADAWALGVAITEVRE